MTAIKQTATIPYLKFILAVTLLISLAMAQEERPKFFAKRWAAGLQTSVTASDMHPHWIVTGMGVIGALLVDQSFQTHAKAQGLMPEPLARLGDNWGGKWAAITILPGIYLAETIRGTPKETICHRLELAFSSLALIGITTEIIKYTVGRERPNKQAKTSFPYGKSFPSGHASFSFGVAEVIRTLYGNRAGTLFYVLAVNTGLSRIHDDKHYLSDVIAGAGLGIGLVRGYHLASKEWSGIDDVQLSLLPQQINLVYHF